MARTFNLPDLGEGLTEAEIVEWKVAEGDTVTLDQEIVEVETAKASVIIPSPFAGVVLTLHGGPGDVMEVGAPLITFADEATVSESGTEPAKDTERTPNLVGYGAASEGARRRRRRKASSPEAPQAVPAKASKPKAKPPVRRLAKELNVDLATVTPTGPNGSISREDVQRAASAPTRPAPAVSPTPAAPGTAIPVRGVRRTIAQHMEVSHTIPAAAAWIEAEATGLESLRKSMRDQYPAEKITALAILCRLVVEALRQVPHLNARYAEDEITLLSEINLGVAVATDRGLVVPVIKRADEMTIRQLAGELARLVDGARANSLTPTELLGQTFTITNFGALGVDGGIPLINHPDVGILGMGALLQRPVVADGQIVARPTLNLSLAFDHRVADGAEASRFLTLLAEWVKEPALLLADQPPA